jgi:hypothetical protein
MMAFEVAVFIPLIFVGAGNLENYLRRFAGEQTI